MSLLAAYKEAKRIYTAQKALEAFEGIEPHAMPNQLRMDISPAGVCVATVTGNVFKFSKFYTCDGYAAALSRAVQEISVSRFLGPGYSVVVTLWPEEVLYDFTEIGSSKKYTSSKAVDQTLIANPEALSLNSAYAYRVLNINSWSEAHYVGLKTDAWQAMQDALPDGVVLARHWGPLATLEVLIEHFHAVFAVEDVVIGVIDPQHVFYFKMEKGTLGDFKISPHTSIKTTENLRGVLKGFGAPKDPKVYIIDLTANPSEADAFCLQASQQESIHMHMVERTELLQTFKMLSPAGSFAFFPIALIQGGKDARF